MKRLTAALIMTLTWAFVNPFCLEAASKKDKEALRDLVDLLVSVGDGAEPLPYEGTIAQNLELPDPAPTKIIDWVPKWATEPGRTEEEVTDNWYHGCSVLVEESSNGTSVPTKLIFKARMESGRDSQSYNFKTTLDGTLEKAIVHHGKLDEQGKPIQGSAVNATAFLDIGSPEVKSRLNHELDLWLYGKHLKPKFRKEHLSGLSYYRNKRKAK